MPITGQARPTIATRSPCDIDALHGELEARRGRATRRRRRRPISLVLDVHLPDGYSGFGPSAYFGAAMIAPPRTRTAASPGD